MPVPEIGKGDHPNDVEKLKHARKALESIFQAGNAKDIVWRAPFPTSHTMGSFRISACPVTGFITVGVIPRHRSLDLLESGCPIA